MHLYRLENCEFIAEMNGRMNMFRDWMKRKIENHVQVKGEACSQGKDPMSLGVYRMIGNFILISDKIEALLTFIFQY